LIVDDDACIREGLHLLLTDAGYPSIDEAIDGHDALRRLRSAPAGLVVLLDLLMPRLDGQQVLNVVATDTHLAGRHAIVLMTAHQRTLPLPLVATLSALHAPVLFKPFDIDKLLETVARMAELLPVD
jgi:two-component system chemotaxis response regulator CheY